MKSFFQEAPYYKVVREFTHFMESQLSPFATKEDKEKIHLHIRAVSETFREDAERILKNPDTKRYYNETDRGPFQECPLQSEPEGGCRLTGLVTRLTRLACKNVQDEFSEHTKACKKALETIQQDNLVMLKNPYVIGAGATALCLIVFVACCYYKKKSEHKPLPH